MKKLSPPKRKVAKSGVARKGSGLKRLTTTSKRASTEDTYRANNPHPTPDTNLTRADATTARSPLGQPKPVAGPVLNFFNNVLTASRMNCAMQCLRKHFWQYEIGLRREETSVALKMGSAWARGMEARWKGATYEEALASAIPEGVALSQYDCSIIAALLAAYYDYYGEREDCGQLNPEVQFRSRITEIFTAEGKIDSLGSKLDGLSVMIENKQTSDSIAPDSEYWLRLSFNVQLYQYIVEARKMGWDVSEVLYDVCRKPQIRPKSIDDLDKDGLKIVVDADGNRIFNQKGKNKGLPRQSPDKEKGYVVKSHVETPDEFSDRLYNDVRLRPDFYFVRKEVPIIDQNLESFEKQRLAIAHLILSMRQNEVGPARDPEAWPRHVSKDTCKFCSFKSFCLSNISVDLNNPPEGFSIQPFNPELDKDYDATETTDESSTAS